MNANERNEIVKLIQPNILPNAVELEVRVTEEEKVVTKTLVLVATLKQVLKLKFLLERLFHSVLQQT